MYEKLFENYEVTWKGLLRISLWFVFFLWLFGALMPDLKEKAFLDLATKRANVTPMIAAPNDPRQVRQDIADDPKKINIAWIGDSSIAKLAPGKAYDATTPEPEFTLLPSDVADVLAKRHGLRDLDIRLYALFGMHAMDAMFLCMEALDHKPDMLVLAVNPVFVYSRFKSVAQRRSLNQLPRFWPAHPRMWPWYFVLSSPSQNAWAAAGYHFKIIRNASLYRRSMAGSEKKKEAGGNIGKGKAPEKKEAAGAAATQAFWILHQMRLDGYFRKQEQVGFIPPRDLYNEIVAHSVPGDDAYYPEEILDYTLEVLKESGIPAIVYLTPIDPASITNGDMMKRMKVIYAALRKKGRAYKGTNVTVLDRTPDRYMKNITFQQTDGIHLVKETGLTDFLSEKIRDGLIENPKVKEQKK